MHPHRSVRLVLKAFFSFVVFLSHASADSVVEFANSPEIQQAQEFIAVDGQLVEMKINVYHDRIEINEVHGRGYWPVEAYNFQVEYNGVLIRHNQIFLLIRDLRRWGGKNHLFAFNFSREKFAPSPKSGAGCAVAAGGLGLLAGGVCGWVSQILPPIDAGNIFGTMVATGGLIVGLTAQATIHDWRARRRAARREITLDLVDLDAQGRFESREDRDRYGKLRDVVLERRDGRRQTLGAYAAELACAKAIRPPRLEAAE